MAKQHWYAVYTVSRHEATVSSYFANLNVETYLPLRRVWSKRTDRRVMIDTPALPGYLFIRCDMTPEIRASVKKTPGVVSLISTDGQPCFIPDEQVDALRILLSSQLEVRSHSPYVTGQTILISRGPLKGAHGILTRVHDGQRRLVVRIDHIGLALSVNVHEADVEPMDGSKAVA